IANVAVYQGATVPGSTPGPLTSNVSTAKCVDENGASNTPGANVQMWDCNGGAAQRWTANTNGTITLANGFCLDATNSGTGNGTPIQATTCWGNAQTNKAQQFIPRADGSIYNTGSGRCLADPASVTTNGTQLILWDCTGGPEQKWTLTPNNA
ncbi:RICIN domain-containing protein, partial [Kitasatospora sp. SUK 42]|uniref:RICIN domain-containing protein n=1 Tax=Kitasatospora sp. SUK 42 TaxID=1588882 RepID=UPI001C317B66